MFSYFLVVASNNTRDQDVMVRDNVVNETSRESIKIIIIISPLLHVPVTFVSVT